MSLKQPPKIEIRVGNAIRRDLHLIDLQAGIGNDNHIARMSVRLRQAVSDRAMIDDNAMESAFRNEICQVRINGRLVHYGRIIGFQEQLAAGGEEMMAISRCDDYLFGDPLLGPKYSERMDTVPGNIVFNPMVDGRVFGNMFLKGGQDKPYFVHWDNQILDGSLWSIPHAVTYLCRELNPEEKHFRNPQYGQILFNISDKVKPTGVQIPMGTRLPDALTMLLEPVGYRWSLQEQNGRIQFRFWKRGLSLPLSLVFPRHGSESSTGANVRALSSQVDMLDSAVTAIHCLGAPRQVETTFELHPAWPPEYNDFFQNYSYADLVPGSDLLRDRPVVARVFRDYVLNESAEYEHLSPFDIEKVVFKSKVLQSELYRRRFYPCISLGDDGKPAGHHNGYHVEMQDAAGNWRPMNETIRILEGECGIRITTPSLPYYLMRPKKIRITASVMSHERLEYTSEAVRTHLQDRVLMRVDVGDRYFHRTVRQASVFYPDIEKGTRASTQTFDLPELRAYADELLARHSRPSIKGPIVLDGIDSGAFNLLGRTIDRLNGRNIRFTSTNGFGEALAPDIVQFQIDVQNQQTTLTLDRVQEA